MLTDGASQTTGDSSSFADRWNGQALTYSLVALLVLLLWNHFLRKRTAKRHPNVIEEAVTEIFKGVLVVFLVTFFFELAEFRQIVVDELHSIVSIRSHLTDPEYLDESFSEDFLNRVVAATYSARAARNERPLLDGESDANARVYFKGAMTVAKKSLSITRS